MTRRICKVLVVEDNHFIRELLQQALIGDGYRFDAVANGSQMHAKLYTEETYDIAVIDYHLPGDADGIALARLAEQHGLGVILVSGTGEQDVLDRIRDSGRPYLQKPFRINELLTAVEAALLLTKRDCERDMSVEQETVLA